MGQHAAVYPGSPPSIRSANGRLPNSPLLPIAVAPEVLGIFKETASSNSHRLAGSPPHVIPFPIGSVAKFGARVVNCLRRLERGVGG